MNPERKISKLEIPAQAEPKAVPVYNGFISFDAEQLAIFYKEHGFAFGLDDRNLFRITLKLNKEIQQKRSLKFWILIGVITVAIQLSETALTDIKFEDEFKETLENIFNDYLAKRRN